MAEWNENPSWTSMDKINGGESFSSLSDISPSDFNALVKNMQYLYTTKGVIDDMNAYDRVGAIYVSTNATSPASIFGGEWERITDRFLIGAGNSYSAGSYGGSKNAIIENKNLPPSVLRAITNSSGSSAEVGSPSTTGWGRVTVTNGGVVATENSQAGNLGSNSETRVPFDVLNPYLAVYIWKRIK